ncbi:histidine kinase [Myroides odoratimimus]|uniref:histidine kinase n=1 Tax=Myroides odoratimimus TaxID=76832 RepID=UPI00257669D7|nr:histidine kinase [Myroides odoratimimus]MDM1397510.1 histidine kinase [Myroides odoratimimus]
MALHYDLGPILQTYNDDQELVKAGLIVFVEESKELVKKIKTGINEKNYGDVAESMNILMPSLEFLGMEQAIEEASLIEEWTQEKGKTKAVKETFKIFKERVKKARKEIQKDFSL